MPAPNSKGLAAPKNSKSARAKTPPAAPVSPVSLDVADRTRRPANGNGNGTKAAAAAIAAAIDDPEVDSELSDPDSNVHSPPGVHDLADSIIVDNDGFTSGPDKRNSPALGATENGNEDESMADVQIESAPSQYPKRKRTSVYNDLSESRIEASSELAEGTPEAVAHQAPKTSRYSLSLPSVKGVIIGHWRDSTVPEEEGKHIVIGFIDIRDRLRTRIQPFNLRGENISRPYPLPPGPGGSWVTFERVHFLPHLVGLDHYQVKEYVRIRTDAVEATNEERSRGEQEAVQEAKIRVVNNPLYDNLTTQPLRAYGADLPESSSGQRPDNKRRRTSNGFASFQQASPSGSPMASAPASTPVNGINRAGLDPLLGHRPTKILLGHWKASSEANPIDRHAVYGILGQNDMFRVKLVRETRDGRYVDGNFPSGAGALWIAYEEVEFEPHLTELARAEIKEYCRVRQYQLDHGETPDQKGENEIKAVADARARIAAGAGSQRHASHTTPQYVTTPPEEPEFLEQANGRVGHGSHELRTSRRGEAKAQQDRARHPLPDGADSRPSTRGQQPQQSTTGVDAIARTNALARREIDRAEATQDRANITAAHRERVAAAAAAEASAAAAAAAATGSNTLNAVTNVNGRAPTLHESDGVKRLNEVWARQEALRLKTSEEDTKIYDGIKYQRKSTGPFMGKLVSQGTIINIDGEDYVEYRVLTRPTFF